MIDNTKIKQMNKIEKLLPSLFAFTIILGMSPYFVWYDLPHLYKLFALSVISLFILNFIVSNTKKHINKTLILLSLYILIVFLCLSFSNEGLKIAASSSPILIIIFILLDKTIKKDIYFKFVKLYALFLILPIFYYILLASGVDLEWNRLETKHILKSIAGFYYREYFGMVILNNQIFNVGDGYFFRLSGIFDEAGVIGTVSALILVAIRFNLKTWYGKIILIGGILSLSLVFYLISFIYLISYKIKYVLILPIIIVSIIYLIGDENEFVNKYLFDRVTLLVTDTELVDNRTSSCFEAKYKDFLESDSIYLGKGSGAVSDTGCDVSSWKGVVYNHGIVGFILIISIYVFILLYILKTEKNLSKKVLLLTILVFALSFYQRPNFDSIYFIILFYSAGIQYKIEESKNAVNQKVKEAK